MFSKFEAQINAKLEEKPKEISLESKNENSILKNQVKF
jgi:hypothetical protein